MNPLHKSTLLVKEIGIPDLINFALYQLQLRSGYLEKKTPLVNIESGPGQGIELIEKTFAWVTNWTGLMQVKNPGLIETEAKFLQNGKYQPFFGSPQQLEFKINDIPLQHWTKVVQDNSSDIKFTWEPARFTWGLALAYTYRLTHDESIPEFFWQKFEEFQAANPVNTGANWSSGQEVALRALMWIITVSGIKESPSTTKERLALLDRLLRQHVERLLPTLSYARSQHNNHILSEALGLVLAGDVLQHIDHRAERWIRTGEREFEHALLHQIDTEGNYSQHSANYHRMMLQLALLYECRMRKLGKKFTGDVQKKLAAATRWLVSQLDIKSGRVPNLGHNDGTLLLPFGCTEYRDYRPTVQAAATAFLGTPCLPPGPWDELAHWLELEYHHPSLGIASISSPAVHKVGTSECWGTLRGVRYQNRPAHADQLHVEIWWKGINIARDAGTYLYTAPPPWQNALDSSRVHNTVILNGLDQMQRVSRFLWLDQAQAKWHKSTDQNSIIASHNGYRNLGITHQRTLQYTDGTGFIISDSIIPQQNMLREYDCQLHWLLPDWQWHLSGQTLVLNRDALQVKVSVSANEDENTTPLEPVDISLIRAGVTLIGQRQDDVLGWESDTYDEKHPGLSFSILFKSSRTLRLATRWTFVDEKN